MELVFTAHGHSCDLALHPVSEKTARTIEKYGSEVYSMKALDWWRKGKTATWGMRIDDLCHIQVSLDGKPVEFDYERIVADPLRIRRRMFLDSRAKYLCVLGFDNEVCRFSWKWTGVDSFNPDRFEFMVHQWDRIMGEDGYFILDEIRYNNEFATNHDWCDASGFTLVPPRIIDLDEVRRELAEGGPEHIGSPFPSPRITASTKHPG
ncbi:hypothetical protein [Pseudodesulfovibrio indicus]|uniref:Uncharacterized protein n=1 Tax=Pseudodesulfovibrio indicus TaxID=1716143 RepID=A0A126QMA3_9BACT|nr:hypothetical protein [Pseudodesulfovibrio indicus]AMK10939.1 hypothetical protein AWY79_07350 [Pseudodesulfovibrio indicus]TDT91933.1 hypothetical protein EDC59_101336 [Pseudodesulfovibrio indicus]